MGQGRSTIAIEPHSDAPDAALLALVYAAGARPSAAEVAGAADVSKAFAVTFAAPQAEGWVEALVTGLAFDVVSLSPAPSAAVPPVAHRFGLDSDSAREHDHEVIEIRLGPHLVGGGAMLPIVRAAVALAAALAEQIPPAEVVWLPAASAMAPEYFRTIVAEWLRGGAFPGLGLTALRPDALGGMRSYGLTYFTGQELDFVREIGEAPEDCARHALRALHLLVEHGPVTEQVRLDHGEGVELLAKPSADGRTVRAWRQF